ncbi:ATP-binding protein [Caulobacter endophyticus]|uniref:ATP-binding protein n=1 Tax=Caulobacter endophyticus TaxID=2172652 RepID=UPI002410B258|nr:ATP-binding protein [Caulobacter endophyticus]MDG2528219.1 GAF domain-containing protein [Caulobacter endophyticus]
MTQIPDLDACAAEPIRIPGGVQPHGALVVVEPVTGAILQSSANLPTVLRLSSPATGLSDLDPSGALAADLEAWRASNEPLFLRTITLTSGPQQVAAHQGEQGIIVEFEAPPASEGETLEALYPRLRRFVAATEDAREVRAIAEAAVREVRALTGFNRVMLYSFDTEGVGTVIAEDGDGVLPSYLDLRFPASDIPAQARALYRLNRLRLIPDANYTPSPIEPALNPIDGQALDLSGAALRSVSPIHLQYMRNMGTLASMSISILVDGELWGLISGHSAQPHLVNPQVRTACDFLGQIVSLQIAARVRAQLAADHVAAKRTETALLSRLAPAQDFQVGLVQNPDLWLDLVHAQGAALVVDGVVSVVGQAPSVPEIELLTAWLKARGDAVFTTDALSSLWPPGEVFAPDASGVLAISISQLHPDYILWFRPEVIRTVTWSGDPTKPAIETGVLHPRKSFEAWKQQVRLRSLPWTDVETETAADFRNAIQNFVLRRAEERAELTAELERSNKELEAFSYSISHDLRAPFRHIVGYAELLKTKESNLDDKSRHYIQTIVDSALTAGRLVDDLLAFSQLGRSQVTRAPVDMRKLAEETRRALETEIEGRVVRWEIGNLPPAFGDAGLLRQVMMNLVDNALKYTRPREEAVIAIAGEDRGDTTAYWVRDNGVGFDMAYVGKLFGVFQRLHRIEDFEGTGIGLALSKRIIDRHHGTIEAYGKLGQGATLLFTLPKAPRKDDEGH